MLTELIATAFVLLVLVFLSTIESAYESLSEVSLRVLTGEREEGTRRARFFRELMEHRRRFELMLILGTQLSIAAIAILLADVFMDAGVRGPLILTFVASFVVVVLFRQLIPRLLAQNHPEDVFWALLPLFQIFYVCLSVVVAPVSQLLNRMRKPEPEEEIAEGETDETKDEIQAFIDVGEEEGIIEEAEGELIQSIIEFSDTRVDKIMRPRPQIVAIEASSTIGEARRLIVEAKHSRIPVYRDQIDNIEGVVYVRDLLALCDEDQASQPITRCMRPAYFVPESKSVRELLEDMQKARVQIAMVIDEYGGVAGLVTLEDIVEEFLGETEDLDEAATVGDIVELGDGSYLIDGSVEIRRVELLYNREVEADDFKTIAGLIIRELGHVPATGEKLDFKGLEFEVVDADGKRVNRVKLRKADVRTGEHDEAKPSRAEA
ncbi:MAG TPA: hemolysin family protein [Blastocatellia bacterium]|nr:hemolysin family protein [Blastocatellia bacterium]